MKQILLAILLMAAWLCSVARAQSQWSMGGYAATGVTPALPVSARSDGKCRVTSLTDLHGFFVNKEFNPPERMR